MKGEEEVAYETKALLVAIAKLIRKSKSLEDAYNDVAEMANAEGVVIKPYEEAKAELDGDSDKVTST